MTFGEKLRKYRLLKGLTLKDLGKSIGFSEKTAGVRINQYEIGRAIPKMDIRSKLSRELDVDMEALSDLNIQSYKDVMYILFELEELYGLEIYQKSSSITFSLDRHSELSKCIRYWVDKKAKFKNPDDYERWKSRFFTNYSNSPPKISLGERIRMLRTRNGLSLEELGRMCCINSSTMRKYENGKRTPNDKTINRISQALDIKPVELFIYKYEEIITGDDLKLMNKDDINDSDLFLRLNNGNIYE